MSLLDQLKVNKNRLKVVDTRVTTLGGIVLLESRRKGKLIISELGQRSAGFVVDTKPDLQVACVIQRSQTVGQLSFGSQDVVHCAELMKVQGITHVLSLIPTESSYFDTEEESEGVVQKILHKQVDVLDVPEFCIKDYLDDCFDFINSGLLAHGHVFVHCNAGVSRSATFVMAYLMKFRHMSYLEALAHVQQLRPISKPNSGFDLQLRDYDKELRSAKSD